MFRNCTAQIELLTRLLIFFRVFNFYVLAIMLIDQETIAFSAAKPAKKCACYVQLYLKFKTSNIKGQ